MGGKEPYIFSLKSSGRENNMHSPCLCRDGTGQILPYLLTEHLRTHRIRLAEQKVDGHCR